MTESDLQAKFLLLDIASALLLLLGENVVETEASTLVANSLHDRAQRLNDAIRDERVEALK